MNREEIVKGLEHANTTESLIWIRRRFDSRAWRGFVVGLSESLVLIQVLNAGTMRLSGYTAVRLKDVVEYSDDESFAPTALKLLGERPRPQLDLLLVDMPGLLSSVGAHFPLLELYREKEGPGFYVGRIAGFGKRKVWLQTVSRRGTWGELNKLECRKITRVDFGNGYDEALWLVARREPRPGRAAS